MNLKVTPLNDSEMGVLLTTPAGSTLCSANVRVDPNPCFKSGDIWIAEIHAEQQEPTDPATEVTVVKVWINPEDGTIMVTQLGHVSRSTFALVAKWLVRLSS